MVQNQEFGNGKQISVIIFEVGWEQFAIDILEVKEIIQAGQIRRLPRSYDFIEGIYNYRGEIIHIVSLKKKLNLDEYRLYNVEDGGNMNTTGDLTKSIIILSVDDMYIGFIVDHIINIAHIDSHNFIRLSPIFQTSVNVKYVKGIIKFEDRPRILLNLSKVLSEVEQSSIQQDIALIKKN